MNNKSPRPVCVVVGVGPGNGRAFAARFADAGYAVALLARSNEYSTALAAEFDSMRAYACDVTDAAAITQTFAQIKAELGPVDVLLYNAGSGTWGTFDELADEAFETAWKINVLGFLRCARAVAGSMRERGRGAIVVSGATASLRGKPFTAAFAQAKAAQRSLAQSLARQLGPEGVHVALVIIDGPIANPSRAASGKDPDEFLEADDIAATVYHLATQARSAWSFEVDLRPFRESW